MNIKPGKADSKLAGKDTLFIIFWIIGFVHIQPVGLLSDTVWNIPFDRQFFEMIHNKKHRCCFYTSAGDTNPEEFF